MGTLYSNAIVLTSAFDWLTKWVGDLSTPAKNVITAILALAAFFFILSPATSAMRAFGNKNWGEGFSYLVGAIAIATVAIVAIVGLHQLGENVGEDLNKSIRPAVALGLPLASIAIARMRSFKHTLLE